MTINDLRDLLEFFSLKKHFFLKLSSWQSTIQSVEDKEVDDKGIETLHIKTS